MNEQIWIVKHALELAPDIVLFAGGRVPAAGGDGGGTGGQGGGGKKAGDPVVPQQSIVRFDPHIVSKVRYSVVLKPSQTTTGLNKRALVIKKGVFKQGRTYIIQLKIKHKGQ